MQVIILTRSDKYNYGEDGGYCVAGIDPEVPDKWVRLCGPREHFKITNEEAVYENGSLCEPLDLIEVDAVRIDGNMVRACNAAGWGPDHEKAIYNENMLSIQPENYLVDGRFRFIRKIDIDSLLNMAGFNPGPFIFGDSGRSLSIGDAIRNNSSLTMMKVDDLELYPKKGKEDDGYQAHYRARFKYNGVVYDDISVTDPDYLAKDTDFSGLTFGESYLIMSLGEEFRERHYKLIAKIFEVVYVIGNNKKGMFHAFRDCPYLQKYNNVKYALYNDAVASGLVQCAECKKRRDAQSE
ncbi:MAG: hypothetical protein IKE18_03915 [Oscillospiraceae bacterium]|nr:hypothetical protein [Oscillospiraceae bacterium]